MLFFLLLMLLFRSVCHQVSNQADKLDLLAICFLLLVSCMLRVVKKHCPEEVHLNRWAKRRLVIKNRQKI